VPILCATLRKKKLKCPKSRSPLSQWVNDQSSHEKTNCYAQGNLYHAASEVEDDSIKAVEAIGGALLDVSERNKVHFLQ
jgi:hypothetical protein